jgi:DNA polymerase III epsilon subunit-like protein
MFASDATISVIDFEATGAVEGYPSEPWQIGIVVFRRGHPAVEDSFASLLRVGDRPFNPYAPGRHEEQREEMSRAPSLPELWPQLKPWLHGRPLAAHNMGTEKKFLRQAFPLHPIGPWIDTLKLARLAHPDLSSHKLEDLLKHFGLMDQVDRMAPGLAPHDALYDAVACAVLLETLLALPGWSEVSVTALSKATPARYHRTRSGSGPSS